MNVYVSSHIMQVLTIVTLCLIRADYADWYTIVLIFLVCGLTFLFIVVSLAMHFMTCTRAPDELSHWATTVGLPNKLIPRHSSNMQEAISAALFVAGWFIVVGVGADAAWHTNEETGWDFGWMAVR